MPCATSVYSGRAQRPPPAHPLWCRKSATPALLCTTGVHSGRTRRPPVCAPSMVSRKCPACYALRDQRA
eukprot:2501004-Pyramimonas_sp.AAC.1